MIIIEDAKRHPAGTTKAGKPTKDFTTFAIRTKVNGEPAKITGWRYFPDTGTVAPPSTLVPGRGYAPTCIVNDVTKANVLEAYKAATLGRALDHFAVISDVWDTFLGLVDNPEELDEVLYDVRHMKSPTLAQQILVLLLEVNCNPIEEIFGGRDE